MNFALFLLLNAVLLIRPEELFPEITGLRLYLIVIVACAATSLSRLLELLSPASLRRRPVAVCVLLYFASTLVSLVVRGRVGEALFDFGPEFAKVILYYFLLLAVVDTRERFRLFVAWLVLMVVALTGVALLQHHGVVTFENIVPCLQPEIDPVTGEEFVIVRLVSSGIFQDPNDLCQVLGLGILCCVYCATSSRLGPAGYVVWLLPVPLFLYALLETHSRGGLMGVLAGWAAYLYSRFGGPRALPFAAAGAVVVLALVGGRQGSIGGGGTAHERLMIWADSLGGLFSQPFYIPTGLGDGWIADETGHVAHNSFVQAYVEQGVFGGAAFLCAFYFAARILDRLGRGVEAPGWVVGARHFAFAVLAGYGMGCYSLTRNLTLTTYLVLGLVSVLLDKAAPTLPARFRVDGVWFQRGLLFGLLGLVLIKLATQGLGQAGV